MKALSSDDMKLLVTLCGEIEPGEDIEARRSALFVIGPMIIRIFNCLEAELRRSREERKAKKEREATVVVRD